MTSLQSTAQHPSLRCSQQLPAQTKFIATRSPVVSEAGCKPANGCMSCHADDAPPRDSLRRSDQSAGLSFGSSTSSDFGPAFTRRFGSVGNFMFFGEDVWERSLPFGGHAVHTNCCPRQLCSERVDRCRRGFGGACLGDLAGFVISDLGIHMCLDGLPSKPEVHRGAHTRP
jgi:hypothetical protein